MFIHVYIHIYIYAYICIYTLPESSCFAAAAAAISTALRRPARSCRSCIAMLRLGLYTILIVPIRYVE